MAKKDNPKKDIKTDEGAQKKKKGSGMSVRLFLVLIIILSAVFLPTAIFLFVGLMPSFVAFFVDRSRKKRKCVTVGAMNLAGCMPFLLELWTTDHTFARAMDLLLDPAAITLIYSAAGIGYFLDWFIAMVVSGYMYQRGVARAKSIKKYQEELVERWGIEVTNTVPLDPEGFPIEQKPSL